MDIELHVVASGDLDQGEPKSGFQDRPMKDGKEEEEDQENAERGPRPAPPRLRPPWRLGRDWVLLLFLRHERRHRLAASESCARRSVEAFYECKVKPEGGMWENGRHINERFQVAEGGGEHFLKCRSKIAPFSILCAR